MTTFLVDMDRIEARLGIQKKGMIKPRYRWDGTALFGNERGEATY